MLLVPGCFKWCEFNATHSSEGLHELRSQLCGQCGNRNYEQLESSRAEGIKKIEAAFLCHRAHTLIQTGILQSGSQK